MTFTLTISKPLKDGINQPFLKKWDITKIACTGKESIVIRVRNNGKGMTHSNQYTMHPYKRYKKKWKQWIWFKWLKFRVWIGDLYKS